MLSYILCLRLRLVRVKVFPEKKIFSCVWLHFKKCFEKYFLMFCCVLENTIENTFSTCCSHFLTFSQLPNEYILSFIPKNTNKTQKRSHFLGEIAITIAIAISPISIVIALSVDRDRRFARDRRDRDQRDCDQHRSAQFRWSRSQSWCVGVDHSVWLGVWVGAVKLWERQCVSERRVRVRKRRKTFKVKIWAEIDFRCFWLNLRSNWKYFQFDRIYHANQTCYFPENDFRISFSAKTNGPLVTKFTKVPSNSLGYYFHVLKNRTWYLLKNEWNKKIIKNHRMKNQKSRT